MKSSQLAAQFYTLRDYTKTAADLAGTMEKVRKIGYETIQVSAIPDTISPEEIRQIAKDNGLTICSSHDNGGLIAQDTDKIIDRLHRMGVNSTAYPYPHQIPMTHNGAVQFAKVLNTAAEKMATAGIELSYHNHAIEFQKYDGEFFLDIIYREAPALKTELDTFWVQSGGQDPEKWIRKFPGRQTLLHLKDYGIVGNDRRICHIGGGNLDWTNIIKAGEECGVKYFIVEQDDCYGISPFDELKASFDYISSNFFN